MWEGVGVGGREDEAREEDGRVEGVEEEEEEDGGGGFFLEGFLEGFLVGFFEGFSVGFWVGFLGGFLETPVEVVVGIFLGPPFLGRVCAILGGCSTCDVASCGRIQSRNGVDSFVWTYVCT